MRREYAVKMSAKVEGKKVVLGTELVWAHTKDEALQFAFRRCPQASSAKAEPTA